MATSAVLLTATPALAQQDGLVNVNVGDVSIADNVEVGVAANVAAQVCGVQVNAAVIADQVVGNNEPLAVCTTPDQQAVVITP